MDDMLSGRYTSMWHYALHKTNEIGVRGIFAGWSLSLLKDSLGCATFFCTFEYVKAQAFYSFVRWRYSQDHHTDIVVSRNENGSSVPTIRPHFAIEPTFLLLAGMSASFAQALIQYTLSLMQDLHYNRLDTLDALHSRKATSSTKGPISKPPPAKETFRNYAHAYHKTFRQVSKQAERAGGLWRWAYKGFWWNTLRAMPSTSAGLIIFELVRRRYALGEGEVRIRLEGRDVLLV